MTAQNPAENAAPKQGFIEPNAVPVFGGVLQRMGEVMGPGAIYSLVHYGAFEEGLRIGAANLPSGDKAALQIVAGLFGVGADLLEGTKNQVNVRVRPSIEFNMESRGSVALFVGLLEGVLTATHRSRMQATNEPTLAADGTLQMALAG